ncbi:hypothetical protein KSS87_001184, partial [Heliosperma pusillum]
YLTRLKLKTDVRHKLKFFIHEPKSESTPFDSTEVKLHKLAMGIIVLRLQGKETENFLCTPYFGPSYTLKRRNIAEYYNNVGVKSIVFS